MGLSLLRVPKTNDSVHQNTELKITPDPKNPEAREENPQPQPNN